MAITRLDFTDVHDDTVNDAARSLINAAAIVQMPALKSLCSKLTKLAQEIIELNIEQRSKGYDVRRDREIFEKLEAWNDIWTSQDMANVPIVRATHGYAKRHISLCREATAQRMQAQFYGRAEVPLRHHRRAANE